MKTKLFTLLFAIVAGTSMASAAVIGSGICGADGDNLTWELTDDGVLTISGTGAMKYYAHLAPWYDSRESIETVIINDGVTAIGWRAFMHCTGLTNITIPNSVTTIGGDAFEGCTSLTSVTIPNSVTEIGYDAFSGCTGLTNITIPNSVTTIGEYAFSYCTGLTSITIPNSVTKIGDYAFDGCTGLTSVTIPNSVTTIGFEAFDGCTSLTSVTIPNSVTEIGCGAFMHCTGLTNITIPNSVTTIGEYAFSYCTGLTSIIIPNSVTEIGSRVFSGCTSLPVENGLRYADTYLVEAVDKKNIKTAMIKDGTRWIGDAFDGCTSLTSVTIPNSVTEIGCDAFSGCTSLTSVTIPNSVTTIDSWVFSGCTGLTSIIIPNSVTTIGNDAFIGCTDLTSVTIPNSVMTIYDETFANCSELKSVTLGAGIEYIWNDAFENDSRLSAITLYAERVPDIINDCDWDEETDKMVNPSIITDPTYVFKGVSRKAYLYVPAKSVHDYEIHPIWGEFNVLPIGAEVVNTDQVSVTTDTQSADVTWPTVTGAVTYELVIRDKDGNIICTLVFNSEGQLQSIAFHAPARDKAPAAVQQTGFRFTVTGLDSGTTYAYTLTAKDAGGKVLDTQTGTFTTESGTGVEDLNTDALLPAIRKIIEDGQVRILLPDGKCYDLRGTEVTR